jgi:[NiFe] hydrogenase diaphorase moiety large subunit
VIDAVLARHGRDPTRLVQILRDVVEVHGHVPAAVLTAVAAGLGLPRARVEGVADFYSFLGTHPRGRYRIHFSDNVTDRMAGAAALRAQLVAALHGDPEVHVDVTGCTGLCDQGPALLVNGRPVGRLDPPRIGAIASLVRGRVPLDQWPQDWFVVESRVLRRDRLLDAPLPAGGAVTAALRAGPAATLAAIEQSGLRGRGGAGFSTAAKWRACAAAPGDRVIVCNADEGEPGTFKDRELLGAWIDAVLDGMTVAAVTVGATQGFLYLRAEYPFLVPGIEAALARRRAAGLLGPAFTDGRGFDVALHLGAGAYVCGEESALLESLEGKRGIPRNRPPYPVTRGYLGRPTVVNNVETLALAALVAARGADALRSVGTARSSGTKVLSVAGDVARPGVYEWPFGVTVREVLAAAGAHEVSAVQVGGPSGTLLSPRELDRRIAFEDVPCAGAVTVFGPERDVLETVAAYADFFAHESCGFCTPCRVGTTLQRRGMERVLAGRASRKDLEDLQQLADVMRRTSHCGLGATAGNPVRDALARFRPAFEQRLATLDSVPSFDLDAALAPAREVTGRQDPGAHLEDILAPEET